MARLLVTGASGFLGGELVALAVEQGWEVVGTFHSRRPAGGGGGGAGGVRDPSPHLVELDVRDEQAVRALVALMAPEVVIHTAYVQDGPEAEAVNVGGSAAVAAAAAGARARLVHLSTDAIFRGDLGRPLVEADPPDPVTGYGATKARAEQVVVERCPDALLVRTSLLYGGPGHEPSRHEEVALAAARGEREMAFFSNEIRSPVQVGDLARALLELARSSRSGALHVAGADAVSRLEFAQLIVGSRGGDPAPLRSAVAGEGRPRDCPLDSSVAACLLSTRMRGAREVLAGGH